MPNVEFQLATILSVPFEENCYVIHWKGMSECLVVDPGLEPEKIIQHLSTEQLTPAAILNTHGHADHTGGNEALKQRWPDCPLVIGSGDADKLTDPVANLSSMFGLGLVSPPADRTVDEGDLLEAAGFSLKVLHVPGHTAGHVAYLCDQTDPAIVFEGDVIFAGGIGRTDFPDGDFRQLNHSIRQKLFTLPEATVLLSGHGPPTTVGEEKRSNPINWMRS